MAYEDFTTYTEVDPNSHIAKTAQHVDFEAYGNEDAYLYKDKGLGHFTDFEHLIDVKFVDHYGNYVPGFCWSLTNDIDDMKGTSDANKHAIGVKMSYEFSPAQRWLRIFETYEGTRYWSTAYVVTAGTTYYLKIIKSGTSFQLKIYSDSARTNLLATLSLTMHADPAFQYIFAAQTYNKASSYWVEMDIENLDLQEGQLKEISDSAVGSEIVTRPERKMSLSDQATGQEVFSRSERVMTLAESAAGLEIILKTRNLIVLDSAVGAETVIKAVIGEILKLVTDSATGSEVIKRLERSMVISEFATGVEQILKTRHLSITDLASGLDQILKTRILPTITDTAVGSESILKERRLLILDAGLGAEQISRPERYISISDLAQGIEEILKTRNVATIIDMATGEELVTAIKPGVSPTKLFLIIGNIAIQLTGD